MEKKEELLRCATVHLLHSEGLQDLQWRALRGKLSSCLNLAEHRTKSFKTMQVSFAFYQLKELAKEMGL